MTANRDIAILGGELRLTLTSETADIPNQPISLIPYDRYEPGMKVYHNTSQSEVDVHYVDKGNPEKGVWFDFTLMNIWLSEFELKDTTSREISKGTVGLSYYGKTIDLESMRIQDRESGTYYDYVIDLNPTVYT